MTILEHEGDVWGRGGGGGDGEGINEEETMGYDIQGSYVFMQVGGLRNSMVEKGGIL